jgi:ABC-2 type transport system permease protein
LSWRAEGTKVWAFTRRSWIMTRRNAFTLFEMTFWPCIGLASIGFLTEFLALTPETRAFVLIGVISLSVVQVCQLDVAYALLFDMWSKSVKYQFMAPIHGGHLVVGSWLMGVLRGGVVFGLMGLFSWYAFDFNFGDPGLVPLGTFVLGLFLNGALVGTATCILILWFGPRAEVAAWSLASIMLLLCGIYYPVDQLPPAVTVASRLIPLTYFLEYFRTFYGFPLLFGAPLAKGFSLAWLYLAGGLTLLHFTVQRARRTGMLLRLSE